MAAKPTGAPSGEQEEELKKLATTLQKTKSQLLEQDQEQRQVLGSLYQINKRMRKMSEKRGELTDKVFALEGNVKSLARTIAQLERKIEGQRFGLQKRLKALYMLNGQGAMRILFSATSAHEFDRNLKFLKIVSNRDYELIRNYEANRRELSEKRERLEAQVRKLVDAEQELKDQSQMLIKQQASKTRLLNRLKKSRKLHLAKMKGIRRHTEGFAADAVSKDLALLLEDSFFERRGQMSWPIDGILKRRYGFIRNDEYRFRLSHKGIFFSAARGSEVLAVFPGQISYVGPLPGYGQAVIIDHGDHYYTVYAHNSDVEVEAGDQIKEGQVIARSGASAEDGPGIYFEVRHFSEAIDPEPWLQRENTIAREKL